ncbi:MAG: efflux RND transporter periplasmic adaptor subunit [Vicinamibacterales bacterium]
MDIARPRNRRREQIKRALVVLASVVVLAAALLGAARLKPAAPVVDAATLWSDTVQRGSMVRQVRGLGTLVPEDLRWIAAPSAGRVERIAVRPGTIVTPGTVILELTNPQLEQELQEAVLRVQAAEAGRTTLELQLQNETLQQRAALAATAAEHEKSRLQADMNDALFARRLVSELTRRQSAMDAEQWAVRRVLAEEQLAARTESGAAQIRVQQAAVEQARALAELRRRQRDELSVRAGISGVLQVISVDVGQQVAAGVNLARVADSARLKAEVKIAETQAKDVQVGQRAHVDTRNGVVSGRVTRIDPSVQSGTRTLDVAFDEPLPKGAVPDLSIDGLIELERLDDVLFVGRPAAGQEHGRVSLFRIEAGGSYATRVPVALGRSSVNTIEIVDGLSPGDRVILSDMAAWDGVERVRLR